MLLHGNLASSICTEPRAFIAQVREARDSISDAQITELLEQRDWRGQLCAAWLAGLGLRRTHQLHIGELLLASEFCYAGQGYCLALCCFGTDVAVTTLQRYLERYLSLGNRYFDQCWALGALAYCAPERAEAFRDVELWKGKSQPLDPHAAIREFRTLMAWIREQDLIVR